MPAVPPKSSIVSRLQAGTDSAAAEVDKRYRERLCRLVEREMDRRYRRKEGTEDVVQSALRTFYRRNAAGEFRIDFSSDLWHLLVKLTRRKILKRVEKLRAAKRDAKREVCPEGDDLPGREPTPEEAAIAAELIEWTLAGLDETSASVFLLLLSTHTEQQIATKMGCTRAQVRTRLNHIRDRVERLEKAQS